MRTVAVVATWQSDGAWSEPDDSHTLIESYTDGWAWSVPVGGGARSVAVMVDPGTTDLARGRGAREIYLAEIAKTRQFAAFLDGAEMESGPTGWDASMYCSDQYAGDDWLLVGDAGSFVDPVSSAGVMKALASGWLAAVVVNTCLSRPAMRSVALDFFQAREQEVYAGLARQTRLFLAQAAAGHAHPFWSTRSALLAEQDNTDFHRDSLRSDPSVTRAFDQMRAAPAMQMSRAADARIERRAAVSGREIVLERRLVSDRDPIGVRYICDVDVVTLVELAPSFTQVPEIYEACVRASGPIALRDFLLALSTLVARGWLVWRRGA
ncbi:MAG: tryptophan 7-halogenase [Acidobacteria bacterium]|nr:tryptophan 7-halogenase [Acidobacteriota bacterium]